MFVNSALSIKIINYNFHVERSEVYKSSQDLLCFSFDMKYNRKPEIIFLLKAKCQKASVFKKKISF